MANDVLKYKRNPTSSYNYTIEWKQGRKKHSVHAMALGMGADSIVFLGEDNHVYIGSRKDSEDRAKEILADFNKKYGLTKHIPEIEFIEETVFPFPPKHVIDNDETIEYLDMQRTDDLQMLPVLMYRSKLYHPFSGIEEDFLVDQLIRFRNKADFDVGMQFEKLVEKYERQGMDYFMAWDKAGLERPKLLAQEMNKWQKGVEYIKSIWKHLPGHENVDPNRLNSLFKSFAMLQNFAYESIDPSIENLNFEFQAYNLALDNDNNIILLDVFFTRREQ